MAVSSGRELDLTGSAAGTGMAVQERTVYISSGNEGTVNSSDTDHKVVGGGGGGGGGRRRAVNSSDTDYRREEQ